MNRDNGFESKLRTLIDESTKEREEWKQKKSEVDFHIRELDRQIAALKTTLRTYLQSIGVPQPVEASIQFDSARFRRMTVLDAVAYILTESGGKARISDIRKTLLEAKKLRNPRTAYNHIRGAADRDPRGRFQLLGDGWIGLTSPQKETIGMFEK